MTTKRAAIHWSGTLQAGRGRFASSTSHTLDGAELTWRSRVGDAAGTNPEELLAAAHATCYAMALAQLLEEARFTPDFLDVVAAVSLEARDGALRITRSDIDVVGGVPGIDERELVHLAQKARERCLVSQALAHNVEITVTAALASDQLAAAAGP